MLRADENFPPHSIILTKTYQASRVGKLLVAENPAKTLQLYNLVIERYGLKNDTLITLESEGVICKSDVPVVRRINARVAHGYDGAFFFREEKDYRDGDRIPLIVARNDATFQYKDAAGETWEVPLYCETTLAEEGISTISKDRFVELLKAGVVFDVEEWELIKCPRCKGSSRVPDSDRLTFNKESPCPQCQTGKVWQITKWKIKW
jgi:hypothetical protein